MTTDPNPNLQYSEAEADLVHRHAIQALSNIANRLRIHTREPNGLWELEHQQDFRGYLEIVSFDDTQPDGMAPLVPALTPYFKNTGRARWAGKSESERQAHAQMMAEARWSGAKPNTTSHAIRSLEKYLGEHPESTFDLKRCLYIVAAEYPLIGQVLAKQFGIDL